MEPAMKSPEPSRPLASLRDAARWVVGFPVVSSLRSSTTGYPLRSPRLQGRGTRPVARTGRGLIRLSPRCGGRAVGPVLRLPPCIAHPGGMPACSRWSTLRRLRLHPCTAHPGGMPACSRWSTLRSLRLHACTAHPGGMPACSRWSRALAARTPPDPDSWKLRSPAGVPAIARGSPIRESRIPPESCDDQRLHTANAARVRAALKAPMISGKD
jgi:hypothetical protein